MQNWSDEFLNKNLGLPRVWVKLDNGFDIQELKSIKIDY